MKIQRKIYTITNYLIFFEEIQVIEERLSFPLKKKVSNSIYYSNYLWEVVRKHKYKYVNAKKNSSNLLNLKYY
jgi:hypothetical protein